MPEEKDRTESTDAAMMENDNCRRDVSVVSDGKFLNDGIVEIADKEEYIDEP